MMVKNNLKRKQVGRTEWIEVWSVKRGALESVTPTSQLMSLSLDLRRENKGHQAPDVCKSWRVAQSWACRRKKPSELQTTCLSEDNIIKLLKTKKKKTRKAATRTDPLPTKKNNSSTSRFLIETTKVERRGTLFVQDWMNRTVIQNPILREHTV